MAQTPNGQPPSDPTINLTADDLNPGGVNDQPTPSTGPAGTIDISQDVAQGPSVPTPGPKDIPNLNNPKKIQQKPPIVSPTPTVPMLAPDGSVVDIPSARVHDATAAGASIGSPIITPDGTHAIVPAARLHEALKAGARIDDTGWTPDKLNAHPTLGQRAKNMITGPGMIYDPKALENAQNVELSKMSPLEAAGEVHHAGSIPLVNFRNATTPEWQANNPMLAHGLDFGSGFTSPEQLSIMKLTGALGSSLTGAAEEAAMDGLAGSMSSEDNLAVFIGSGGLKKLPGPAGLLIGKALSAGFGINAIFQAAQAGPKFLEALSRGDEAGAKEALMDVVLNAAFAEQSAEHVSVDETTGAKRFNPTLGDVGVAANTSADALGQAAKEYGGKALEAAGKIPGVGLAKTAGKMVKGVVTQPINAMTEGPEAKITRAAGGSAGVQERDFQQNIPRAMKYIVEENKTNPIKTPEDMAEAAHAQKTELWNEKLGKSHPGETIDGNRVADQITSGINKSTAQHFPEVADAITKWADTFRGPYNLDDAMAAITDFNSKLRQFYKQSPSDQFRMAQADPKLGMLQDAADALRDVAFDKLEKLGEKNIPELRKDYGALNQMQRIFEKRAVVYGRQAPIDFKSSLGAIAAVASGHPLAAAVPYLTKYLNSPEYLLQSGIEKASKAAEAGKTSNPQIEQSRTPVKEIRPPGVKPYQEPKPTTKTPVPGAQAAPAETLKPGTTGTPPGEGKAAKTAPVKASVNPTAATEAPAPGGKIDLETGPAPTEGVRSDFKPYDPENPEGYEKPMPIPAENMPKGMFQRDAHIHEWGHVANAAIEGFGTEGIKSHLNETLPAGNRAAAAARITFGDTGIKIKDGKIDPETLRENFGKMLATTMGGAAANELHSGIPFEMNQGLHSDLGVIRKMGESLGFTPEETESAIKYAMDRAKRNLTIPGVGDMLTQNAGVRESGLSPTMHASPERTEAFAAEMRRLRDDHYAQQAQQQAGSPTELHDTRVAGDNASVSQGADTGREEGDEGSRPAGDLETGRGLKETTTGDENHDEVIRSAGAVPAGVMFPGTDYAIKMFHDPETGSTLGFKPYEAVTPETVRQKLAESREQFGVKTGVAPEKEAFRGSHYSSVPAEEGQIRGESRGKSKAGSEQARLEHDNRVPGVYAYREGVRPEPQIATRANKYDIEGDKAIADISGPQKKMFEDAHASAVEKYKSDGDNDTIASQKALNDAETALKNAGFDGYEDKKSKSGSVFLFGDQPVKENLPSMLGGKERETTGPNLNAFHEKKGLPAPEPTNVPVDKAEGAKIADAYDAMRHAPNDPAVKASYDALKHDTLEQWNELKKQGVKMTVTDDPDYYKNAEEMLRDIHDNKHIAVWSGEGDMPKDHPLREIEPSTGLPYNTLFRGVHDVLGHGVGANDFSEQGEENAYNLHRQSYSPEAIPALATETKGQANWVFNNKALRESGGQPGDFPTQKAALLPEEFHGADPWAHKAAEYAKEGGFTIDPRNGEVPNKGYQVEAAPDVRVNLDHPATPADIQKFYNDNKQIFDEHPEMKVGGYGKELNTSASTDSRANAEALAKKLDQHSIWDVKNGKEIMTGGTGKQTSFPDYPLEQRMADLRGKPGIDLETGAGVAEPEEETGDTTFNFGANAEPQQLSPPYNPETSQRVSSRFPTAVNATENPLEHQLTLEHELIHNNPAVAQRLADKIVKQNKSMVFTPEEQAMGPKGIFDSFIRQAKDNIKSVYERSRQAGNHVSDRIWYDGAHDFTKRDAEANDMSHAQAAGVLATQSPQKDWGANVSLYNRIVDIMKNKGDVTMTPQMEKKGAEFIKQINSSNRVKVAKGKTPAAPWVERKLLNSFKDKTFNEITNPMEKAAWLRLYDEAHNDRGFNELRPDGSVVGPRNTLFGAPEKVAWGGLDSVAKAIKIMQDGSLENISRNLGENHKVRSFYNNIIEPNSPHGDVTADTHHAGLSLMRPVAGSDPETTLNFSGNKSIVSGVRGSYPLYAEATRQAMDEINAEHPDDPPIEYPRQLQSVTWVEWRKMFPPETRTPATKAAVNSIWKEHLDGQITADEARQKISDYADRLRSGVDEGEPSPADEGELPAHQLHGAGDSGRSGGRGPGRTEVQARSRSLKPSADKEPTTKGKRQAEGFLEMMRSVAGTRAGQTALGEK